MIVHCADLSGSEAAAAEHGGQLERDLIHAVWQQEQDPPQHTSLAPYGPF